METYTQIKKYAEGALPQAACRASSHPFFKKGHKTASQADPDEFCPNIKLYDICEISQLNIEKWKRHQNW